MSEDTTEKLCGAEWCGAKCTRPRGHAKPFHEGHAMRGYARERCVWTDEEWERERAKRKAEQ